MSESFDLFALQPGLRPEEMILDDLPEDAWHVDADPEEVVKALYAALAVDNNDTKEMKQAMREGQRRQLKYAKYELGFSNEEIPEQKKSVENTVTDINSVVIEETLDF